MVAPCRDIKPDNVLVAEDGRLMITDFGLSKSYGTGGEWIVQREGERDRPPPRQSNDVVTEGYVPPELLLGAQSYGPEVDIWVRQIRTRRTSGGTGQYTLCLSIFSCCSISI